MKLSTKLIKNSVFMYCLLHKLNGKRIKPYGHIKASIIYDYSEALSSFFKHVYNKPIKNITRSQLECLIKKYYHNALQTIYAYYNTKESLANIGELYGFSSYSVSRLVNKPELIKAYNKKYHKHCLLGSSRRIKYYIPKDVYGKPCGFAGSNSGIQSRTLCKYYQSVLTSVSNIYDSVVDKYGASHLEPVEACPSAFDDHSMFDWLSWTISFELDQEGWYGSKENKNYIKTLSLNDLAMGSTVDDKTERKLLNWLADKLFISHRMGSRARIVYYRNPNYPTIQSIIRANRKADAYDIKHRGLKSHMESISKMKLAGMNLTSHSTEIASFDVDSDSDAF